MSDYKNDPSVIARTARHWTAPMIPVRDQEGHADAARGQQWRLALAWSAWECLRRAKWPKVSKEDCYELVAFDLVEPVPSPKSASAVRWMARFDGNGPGLDDYLDARAKQTKATLMNWFGGKPANVHSEAMKLACALRNVVVHGYLSPTKAKEWGMIPAFVQLTAHVCGVVLEGKKKPAPISRDM